MAITNRSRSLTRIIRDLLSSGGRLNDRGKCAPDWSAISQHFTITNSRMSFKYTIAGHCSARLPGSPRIDAPRSGFSHQMAKGPAILSPLTTRPKKSVSIPLYAGIVTFQIALHAHCQNRCPGPGPP